MHRSRLAVVVLVGVAAIALVAVGLRVVVHRGGGPATTASRPGAPGAPGATDPRTARAADAFVDSIGVNVHLQYTDTSYAAFDDVVRPRLGQLGVRHVRDGAYTYAGITRDSDYYRHLRDLAADGIGSDLITGLASGTTAATDDTLLPQLADWTDHSLESLEGVNEPDRSGLPDWVAQTRAAQAELAATVAGAPELDGVTVIGPSVTSAEAATALGDLSADQGSGNLHDYYGTHEPENTGYGDGGYGSLAYNLRAIAPVAPDQPVTSTESGYSTSTDTATSVPPDVAATYLLRMLLAHFDDGIVRTYVYELLDERDDPADPESSYGLLTSDGSPKPAFTALASTIGLLADPGAPFDVRPLDYRLTGQLDGVQQSLLARRDGSYDLALWLDASVFDPQTATAVDVPDQTVGLDLPAGYRVDSVSALAADGTLAARPVDGGSSDVSVGARVAFVRVVSDR